MIDFKFNIPIKMFPKKRPVKYKLMFILVAVSYLCVCSTIQSKNNYNEYKILSKHYKYMNDEAYTYTKKWSQRKNTDIILVCSIINFESGNHWKTKFNWEKMKRVHSPSDAIGVMQLLKKYHGGKNWKDLYNPDINIQRGCTYLKLCLIASKDRYINIAHNKYIKKNKTIKDIDDYNEFIKLYLYSEACRMYNAGINSNRKLYSKALWKNYVGKIIDQYKTVKKDFI